MKTLLILAAIFGPAIALWPLFIAVTRRQLENRKVSVVQRERVRYPSLTSGQTDDEVYGRAALLTPVNPMVASIPAGLFLAVIWPISLLGIWAYHRSLEIEL